MTICDSHLKYPIVHYHPCLSSISEHENNNYHSSPIPILGDLDHLRLLKTSFLCHLQHLKAFFCYNIFPLTKDRSNPLSPTINIFLAVYQTLCLITYFSVYSWNHSIYTVQSTYINILYIDISLYWRTCIFKFHNFFFNTFT